MSFSARLRHASVSGMPDAQKQGGNSQTLWAELGELKYEVLEQDSGLATVIRFELLNQTIKIGDVLVVMDGPEIRFHGMIGHIDETGSAVAVDRRGSSIPGNLGTVTFFHP